MELFKHYQNGTTHITSTGEYNGYEPVRNETILSIHIFHDEYNIFIEPYGIVISYKYFRVTEKYFSIGKRKRYSIAVLDRFRGYERKRLMHMHSLLTELVTEHSIASEAVTDWTTLLVLATHVDE